MSSKVRSRLLILFASACAMVCASQTALPAASMFGDHLSISQNENRWTWSHSDNGIKVEVSIRGKVEFGEDYKSIKTISEGSSIRIIDERNGTTRKFEATGTTGGIKQTYWVDGREQPLGDEARAWLAKLLEETIVQGGYDAGPRVRKILSERGPKGVLDEISKLRSDYVKRVYFEELAKASPLDATTLMRAIEQAGREISSDYEKATVLIKLGENPLAGNAIQTVYLNSLATIRSDYERGRVLSGLLKKADLNRDGLLVAVRATSEMTSDYEKSQALMKIAAASASDESVRAAIITAARTMKSDYEKANVLAKVSENPLTNNATQMAYLSTLGTITSDYERGRALSTLLKKGGLGRDALLFVVNSTAGMNSDYEKAQMLLKINEASAGDKAVRDALVEAARTIKSEYERGRVLSALFK